ncbi:hypothetical protein CAC42_4386 [Sphaceloma murrayae]|uniref:Uncharacterized protein n=1 Tax=Sphaceloma murrayae TaxID=2082308 RepID=A0A2K1QLF2_9PEZI|nr:hypothetical protein CAC42_4386 [Sphaceloma murrayae]
MAALPEPLPAPTPPKSDSPVDISDNVFMRRVLRLPASETETIYDFKLSQEATELGLTVTPPPVPAPPSHHRRPSIARDGRSISIDSFASKSSRPLSDFSKSWDRTSNGFGSLPSYNRRSSAASSSSRSRDSVLSQPIPIVKQSRNASVPPATSRLGRQSPESPQPSSPHRHLIRGLTKLRLRRHDSDKSSHECAHCTHDTASPRAAVHPLPCGHGYCTDALRSLVEASYAKDVKPWPKCCGQRIPKTYLDLLRVQKDATPGTSRRGSAEPMQRQPSGNTSRCPSTPEPIETVRESLESQDVSDQDLAALSGINLAKALRIPQYAILRTKHTQQRNRLLRWDDEYRAALEAAADRRREAVAREFDRLHDELLDKVDPTHVHHAVSPANPVQHAATIVSVEDKHISAEADLRTAQDTERRNTQTALKHMEAYCRGESANGEPHGRTISEQDRQELAKAQRLRDNMDIRHESAINVLRGEQNQRLRRRVQRHDQEIEQLQRRRERELDRIQRDLDMEALEWKSQVSQKRAVLERWWAMETQICLTKHGRVMNLFPEDILSPLSWCRDPGAETTFDNFADELEDWDDEDDAGEHTPIPPSTIARTSAVDIILEKEP